jgi:carboxymethylenebutenolidase
VSSLLVMATTTRNEQVSTPDGGRFDVTVVAPRGGGAGLLLLQEIFGVGEFLLDRAEALAAEGYVVSCPDVFWRVERNVALPHDEAALERAFELVGRFGQQAPEQTVGDLLAGLGHLRSLEDVHGPVGVMGYCLGGGLAYEAAVAGDPDCCVSYYGSTVPSRLDAAERLRCPTIFHFGADDPYIPLADAERVRDAFADREDVEVHIHDGAGHAFENSFAASFHEPKATAVSWSQTLDFLRRHLASAPAED